MRLIIKCMIMKKNILSLLFLIFLTSLCWGQNTKLEYNILVGNIYLSDPFVIADKSDTTYLYGSGGNGTVYRRASKDLINWTERFIVYKSPTNHWAGDKAPNWAAEVHLYKGKYYLYTTSDDGKLLGKNILGNNYPHRASQIYIADSPRGPFKDFTNNKPQTPADWLCLDATLWIEDGLPYMGFCHEWTQIMNGTVEAVRIPEDLGVPEEAPFALFSGFDAPCIEDPRPDPSKSHVTDGPYLFKTKTGKLGMIWSSWKGKNYVLIAAYSQTGKIKGPWIQDKELLFAENGGH